MKDWIFTEDDISKYTSEIKRHIMNGHDVEDFRQVFYDGLLRCI